MLIDEDDPSIRFVAVHTRNWWPGVEMLIAPSPIAGLDPNQRRRDLNIGVDTLKGAPVSEADKALVGTEDAEFLICFGLRRAQI